MSSAAAAAPVRIPRKWWVLAGYLLLLLASWAWQAARPDADNRARLVPMRADGVGAPVVILGRLPDRSEGSGFDRALLAATDAPVWRLEWPRSGPGPAPEFSTQAIAADFPRLLREAADTLADGPVHVVGEGMGGVVAAEVASRHPALVRSLALVNSPGSQEYTLLGNAVANKFVYFFHHIPFVLADNFLPHFGLLAEARVNRAYSAVFFASDLTEMRAFLRRWDGPALLAHGEDNWVTPPDAARYSALLMPQAWLSLLPGGREFARPSDAAERVAAFHGRVAAGVAPVRPAPAPADAPYPELVTSSGPRFWILMGVISVCTFVAEDPTCLACGLLAAEGIIGFWWAALACTVGIFVGDMVLYLAGYTLGRRALRVPPLRWMVQEHEIDRMSAWFSSPRGLMVIVSSRFIPASRVPTFVTAGILRLSLPRLGLLLFVAALVWTPVLMWLGHTFGPPFMAEFPKYKQHAAWIILGVFLGIWVVTHWLLPLATRRGRREVLLRVTRLTRADFRPAWLRLAPTLLRLHGAALLRGRPAAGCAANPGFGRLGGALGDAKGELLEPFAADARTCAYLRLEAGSRATEAALDFAQRHGYPLALKPEVARGGAGLLKLLGPADLRAALAAPLAGDWLLQPWAEGREFEVVWRRDPGAQVGELVAVVEKAPVEVRGDGVRPLETLIWDDPVAVARADLYQRLHTPTLLRVPADGEVVRLDLSGSWEHGASPRRRAELETDALRDQLDRYCRLYPGLHHARLDLRAADEASLLAGRFAVTEVEGAGHLSSALRDRAEPTSVSRALAVRQLEGQFRAGHANLDHGLRKVPLPELLARRAEAAGRPDGFRIAGE